MSATSLTSRERMLAALKRQPHDHVPFSPYIPQGPWWPDPFFWKGPVERITRMLELGLDPTMDLWFPVPQPAPDVKIKTWRDTSGPEVVLTKEYHTPAGILRQQIRETDEWCSELHTNWIPPHLRNGKSDSLQHGIARRLEHFPSIRTVGERAGGPGKTAVPDPFTGRPRAGPRLI
jgi:hypothetical protein